MRYELLLQSQEPGAAYDPAPVEQLLLARGVVELPDGGRAWRLKNGEVEVRRLNEGGRVVATELKVALSDKTELIREVVIEGVALAAEAGVRLVDPALAKSLTAQDDGLVADAFLRTARYAGEYAGVSEAVPASYLSSEQSSGLKPGTKVFLGLMALIVVLYFIVERFL